MSLFSFFSIIIMYHIIMNKKNKVNSFNTNNWIASKALKEWTNQTVGVVDDMHE